MNYSFHNQELAQSMRAPPREARGSSRKWLSGSLMLAVSEGLVPLLHVVVPLFAIVRAGVRAARRPQFRERDRYHRTDMHRSRKKRTLGAVVHRRPKAIDLGLNLDLVLPPPPTILDPDSESGGEKTPKQIEAAPLSPPAYFVYLPTELIIRILRSVALSRRDLVNLALVSRQVNEFVTPILYEHVRVRASTLPTDASGAFLVNADAQPAIPAHCLRLARDPALGEHVRTLHVSEIHKRHGPLVTCLPVMVDNMPHLEAFRWDLISGMDIESSNLILDAVRDCRELRSLRLGAKVGANFTNTDSHIQISGFQGLHDLSFRVLNSIHDDAARVIVQIITSIVGASPDLKSLDVRIPAYGSIGDPLLAAPYRWPHLTRVSLSGFHVPEPVLAGFLTRHIGIRALRLDIRGTQSVGLAVLGIPRHSLASLRMFAGTLSNALEIVDEHALRRSLRDVRLIGGSWLGFGHHGFRNPWD
ncbi:F-box-like protein [Ceratobasidium sp. AG-Ba]|nr:F-box-like protein [Ceratobasidium sp. AG-Ba]